MPGEGADSSTGTNAVYITPHIDGDAVALKISPLNSALPLVLLLLLFTDYVADSCTLQNTVLILLKVFKTVNRMDAQLRVSRSYSFRNYS